MKILMRLLLLCLSIAYPFVVYWGIQAEQQLVLLALLCLLIAFRVLIAESRNERMVMAMITVVLMVCIWLAGSDSGLKLYPVMINLSLLFVFAASLFAKQSVIERLAKIKEPDLPASAVQYTRHVTQAWCIFFSINSLISLWTVVHENEQVWLIYNGIVAYVLMGLMFAAEWLIRQRVRAQQQ